MVCNSETEPEIGEDCGLKMLFKLYNKFHIDYDTLLLIAHNMSYDFNFLQQYLTITNILKRGKTILQVKGYFYAGNGKKIKIEIKDSYSIISMPLKNFGKCFKLEQAKEILPYKLYNKENIEKQFINLDDCKKYCDIQVDSENLDKLHNLITYEDYFKDFINNCKKWDCLKDDKVDIIKYSLKYCEMDVKVLQLGYNKFGEMLKENCNMCIEELITSAQLAHKYMLKKNVFKDVYELSSNVRDFIMKTMVGGRTMTSNNMMHYVKKNIQDFDAVSLYPSAMYR